MKIWHISADINYYNNIITTTNSDSQKIEFNGATLLDKWEVIKVKEIRNKKQGDFPSLLPGVPVLSEKALKVLDQLIKPSVEVLPLNCEGSTVYAINVIDILDCIDYASSEYKTYSGSSRIMRFIKYSFKPDIIKGNHIFKIIDEPTRKPFVSDEFKKLVEENGLLGFKFDLVWDSNDNLLNKE